MAYRPGNVRRRQAGGRHLIEKRLEEMVVLAINQRDIGGSCAKPLSDGETAEAGTDYDNMAHDEKRPKC
jgi:hypothetical protein